MKRRLMALLLATVMVSSTLSSATWTWATGEGVKASDLTLEEKTGQLGAIRALEASITQNHTYQEDEEVVIVVEVEGDTLVDSSNGDVSEFVASEAGKKANKDILAKQERVKKSLREKVKNSSFSDSYSYTAVINAFTVKYYI